MVVGLNADLASLAAVSARHSLHVNPNKSVALLFSKKLREADIDLVLDGVAVRFVDEARSLGLVMDKKLRFVTHVSKCVRVAFSNLRAIYAHKDILSPELKTRLCDSLVLSHFNYCDVVYGPCLDARTQNRIQLIQNSCLRLIHGIRKYDRISYTLKLTNWLNMRDRRYLHSLCLFHKIISLKCPIYLYKKISFRSDVHHINVRSRGLLTPPMHRTTFFERSFTYNIAKIYNATPNSYKLLGLDAFKRVIRSRLLGVPG